MRCQFMEGIVGRRRFEVVTSDSWDRVFFDWVPMETIPLCVFVWIGLDGVFVWRFSSRCYGSVSASLHILFSQCTSGTRTQYMTNILDDHDYL